MKTGTEAVKALQSIGRLVSLGMLCAVTAAPAAGGERLPEAAERGKQIYHAGTSLSGQPITAIVSRGGSPIPASILPCSGCHGEDGKGRPEGGVVPADVTWNVLTKEYGHEHDYGRTHPAFDAASVATAITKGRDPGGNPLDLAMPRYSMHADDMDDLIAYLKYIEDDRDPGIGENSLRVATIVPASGSRARDGAVIKEVMTASIEEINAGGGIHGRQLQLEIIEGGDDATDNLWKLRDRLAAGDVFAVVGGLGEGMEVGMADMAEELEIPMIGPSTRLPRRGDGLSRFSFYLLGGLAEQAAVLGRRVSALDAGDGKRLAVIRPEGEPYERAEAGLLDNLDADLATDPVTLVYQPPYLDIRATVDSLVESGVGRILFLGSADQLKRLADESQSRGYGADLLLPGVFAGPAMFDIDADYPGRLLVGYSTTPADHTEEGIRRFENLHAKYDLDYRRAATQISAYVSVQVLAEGLKRAGRDLSREKLVDALEGLSDFRSGLVPPISFNHSRRIGALGGYVLPVNLAAGKFGATDDWIPL